MVGSLAPVAIFLGVSATVILGFFSFWNSVNAEATKKTTGIESRLDRAGLSMKPQEIVLTIAGFDVLAWLAVVLLLHPSVIVAAFLIPVLGLLSAGVFRWYVGFRTDRRLKTFINQLETALRLMASGVRVGLGLRQAMTIVTEELPDPARLEFLRVIGQTNIGVSVLDAIDDLAERMPGNETLMMSRVIRIQSQSGGDLSRVLEQLAGTIKSRRQVMRKISAITAEGRMSAGVLLSIPPALGLYMVATQHDYGHALLFTFLGHVVIAVIVGLELLGFVWLKFLLRVDV